MKPDILTLAAVLSASLACGAMQSIAQTEDAPATETQAPTQQTPPSRLRPQNPNAVPPGARRVRTTPPPQGSPAGHNHGANDHTGHAHGQTAVDHNRQNLPDIGYTFTESPDDHVIGADDAPVTVIAYASVTCPHCGAWFTTEWPKFKAEQIDTGHVRFVMREFPTSPGNIARAGFAIINCAPDEDYFTHLVGQMQSQNIVFPALKENRAKPVYLEFARLAGMPTEADMNTCLADQSIQDRIDRSLIRAAAGRVASVPAFIVDEKLISGDLSADGLGKVIKAKLSAGVTPHALPPRRPQTSMPKQP